ncbi:hypothetical protein Ari01nite_97640 [Paractinoplanes rishiriensis]|uniref:Uncharacterized protein n=1 Tax=Paractinoplanes rishiriensis TaxID=1050105 RepID=A0A919K9L4_9ACTN|nr:hypothetical protein Ari01nite_97640 [Actinoplanes rishiriensis]
MLVVTGLVAAGLGALFGWIGLDKADQAASVAGALAGVLGLGLSLSTLLTGPRGTGGVPSTEGQPSAVATRPGPTVSADRTREGERQIDIGNAQGVQIGDFNVQHNTFHGDR